MTNNIDNAMAYLCEAFIWNEKGRLTKSVKEDFFHFRNQQILDDNSKFYLEKWLQMKWNRCKHKSKSYIKWQLNSYRLTTSSIWGKRYLHRTVADELESVRQLKSKNIIAINMQIIISCKCGQSVFKLMVPDVRKCSCVHSVC